MYKEPQFTEIFGQKVEIIDLSQPLEENPSEPYPVKIKRISHEDCAGMWEKLFDIPPDVLPTGTGFAGEIVEASSHAGTHIDAPWHYSKYTENRKNSKTVDELPLNWFIGNAVVLDVTEFNTGYMITPADIEHKLESAGHKPGSGDMVLIRTGADRYRGTEDYFNEGSGLSEESVLYLADRGIKVIGTDAWSLDRPYSVITSEWMEMKDPDRLWPAHFAGRKRSYSQIEKLTNLEKLPVTGSTVICLPVRLKDGSGAWSRVVALLPVQE